MATHNTIILSHGDSCFKGVTGGEKKVTKVCVDTCVQSEKELLPLLKLHFVTQKLTICISHMLTAL